MSFHGRPPMVWLKGAHILSIAGIRRRQCTGSRNAFRTKHKSENVAMIRGNPA